MKTNTEYPFNRRKVKEFCLGKGQGQGKAGNTVAITSTNAENRGVNETGAFPLGRLSARFTKWRVVSRKVLFCGPMI
jgi:hypothetical protein